MKRFTSFCVALGLAAGGSTALAEQIDEQISAQDSKPQPIQMTEAQLDNVTAGLLTITIVDAVDVGDVGVVVAIPVQAAAAIAASAAVAVLGTAVSDDAVSTLGNVTQSQRVRNRP